MLLSHLVYLNLSKYGFWKYCCHGYHSAVFMLYAPSSKVEVQFKFIGSKSTDLFIC